MKIKATSEYPGGYVDAFSSCESGYVYLCVEGGDSEEGGRALNLTPKKARRLALELLAAAADAAASV